MFQLHLHVYLFHRIPLYCTLGAVQRHLCADARHKHMENYGKMNEGSVKQQTKTQSAHTMFSFVPSVFFQRPMLKPTQIS